MKGSSEADSAMR